MEKRVQRPLVASLKQCTPPVSTGLPVRKVFVDSRFRSLDFLPTKHSDRPWTHGRRAVSRPDVVIGHMNAAHVTGPRGVASLSVADKGARFVGLLVTDSGGSGAHGLITLPADKHEQVTHFYPVVVGLFSAFKTLFFFCRTLFTCLHS